MSKNILIPISTALGAGGAAALGAYLANNKGSDMSLASLMNINLDTNTPLNMF